MIKHIQIKNKEIVAFLLFCFVCLFIEFIYGFLGFLNGFEIELICYMYAQFQENSRLILIVLQFNETTEMNRCIHRSLWTPCS